MKNNQTDLPSTLMLTAYTWEQHDYQRINHELTWEITPQEIFNPATKLATKQSSTDSQPTFTMAAGVYHLHVTSPLGDKDIKDVVLHPGACINEVVYLGTIGIDDREENFDLSDDPNFDRSCEYLRRLDERDGQREFAQHADALRNPDILPPAQPGHEYDQSLESQNTLQAHPILSQAKQFDGVGMDANRDSSRNQHAAEAQLQPELAPGAQPVISPSAPNTFTLQLIEQYNHATDNRYVITGHIETRSCSG